MPAPGKTRGPRCKSSYRRPDYQLFLDIADSSMVLFSWYLCPVLNGGSFLQSNISTRLKPVTEFFYEESFDR